jgi:hypothetical protein
MFRDIEIGKYGECAVDERSETLRIKVIAFETQGYEKDGAYYEIPLVKIVDEISRKEFILTNEQKFLEGEYLVVIKDFNGKEYVFNSVGSSVQIGEATCTLYSFNAKDKMAKLSLKDANGQEFKKSIHLIR